MTISPFQVNFSAGWVKCTVTAMSGQTDRRERPTTGTGDIQLGASDQITERIVQTIATILGAMALDRNSNGFARALET